MPIDLRPEHRRMVQQILDARVPHCAVWVFGSRSGVCAKPYSDLDLVLVSDEPLSPATLAELSEDFAESDLPFKVDVLEWSALSAEFRRIVERDRQLLRAALGESIRPSAH